MTELSLSGMQLVHKSTATVTLVVLALAPRSLGCLPRWWGRCDVIFCFILIMGFTFRLTCPESPSCSYGVLRTNLHTHTD